MRSIRLLISAFLILCTGVLSANDLDGNGTIKGKIVTTDGKPAGLVTVVLKGTKKSTITEDDGTFVLNNVKPGTYTLQVRLVGYSTKEETVTVSPDATAQVTMTLEVSDTQLQEVEIATGRAKFGKKESEQVARLPIKNLENPQVYSSISKELLKEQVITNFDDALKNTPGLTKLWSSTGRPSDGAGYFSIRGFAVQPTMINGVPGLTNGGIDPANVERIEVIKGPSSTLFGSSYISFGGLLNIVTKRPYDHFGGEVGYTIGGFGLSRFTADVNAPLNDDKSAILRLNAAYHTEGSFQDAGFKKSFFIAPSLAFKANDRLSFLINAEIYNSEATNTMMLFLNRSRQLIARTPEQLHMNFNKSYTSNDLTYKNPTVNFYGQANYKISNSWTSQTNLSRSSRKSDGYYSYVMFLDAGVVAPSDSLASRYAYYQNSTTLTTDIQQNFIGDFKIGKMRNRVVLGLDFNDQSTTNNNSASPRFDIVDVTNPKDASYGTLNRAAVDAKIAGSTGSKNGNSSQVYSAYVSDVFNITDALLVMASVRVDRFESKGSTNYLTSTTTGKYGQTAVSPKFGIVYQVVKEQVSVFANYMNGFKNVASVNNYGIPGYSDVLKPQQANQWEGGVKLDVLDHKLGFTASYYDIKVSNTSLSQTVTYQDSAYNVTVQNGTQVSKGVELELAANPVPGLNIIAGYSYNDSKMTKAYYYQEGRRPVSAGPNTLVNLWASYTFVKGDLKGLGAGFGGNYASDNVITNDSRTGRFTLPAYTVLNATVFYNAAKYRLALKVDNVANKEYFSGWTTLEKQMPRRLAASFAYKF
ncbi:TonB-dependent receptor [[Flexibacter] sp. ATCC 35208]|uniref:TonB-dependent receptor n=1 Tax=[Flexibacter] sp. ATCC 35208 TaxID=1936242 RepID=UPI0009C88460|nr:TonB-dependent receptor [[Flexibacter] sp. ATCC 35208]OMP80868.1 TonB-dependent siderophore receptor [[Flexibacter] sp. ATCC 35208]